MNNTEFLLTELLDCHPECIYKVLKYVGTEREEINTDKLNYVKNVLKEGNYDVEDDRWLPNPITVKKYDILGVFCYFLLVYVDYGSNCF